MCRLLFQSNTISYRELSCRFQPHHSISHQPHHTHTHTHFSDHIQLGSDICGKVNMIQVTWFDLIVRPDRFISPVNKTNLIFGSTNASQEVNKNARLQLVTCTNSFLACVRACVCVCKKFRRWDLCVIFSYIRKLTNWWTCWKMRNLNEMNLHSLLTKIE